MWSSPGTPAGTGPSAPSRVRADTPAMGRPIGTAPSASAALSTRWNVEVIVHSVGPYWLTKAACGQKCRIARRTSSYRSGSPGVSTRPKGDAGGPRPAAGPGGGRGAPRAKPGPQGGRGEPEIRGGAGEGPQHRRDEREQRGRLVGPQPLENGLRVRGPAVTQ